MILRQRRMKRRVDRADHARGEDRSRQARAKWSARTWWRTPRAIRSSRSSCWRPTRRWPRCCRRPSLHFLRRVHEPPEPRKLQALTTFVARAGLSSARAWKAASSCKRVHRRRRRPARRARRELRRAAQSAEGGLQPRGGRALRPGQRVLLPLHLADSPLSRPDGPSAARRRWLAARSRADDFDELALLGEHCSDREQRAEAAERELTKVKLLNYLSHADRRGDGRGRHRRRGVRPVRARRRTAGRRTGPRRRRWPTTTIASTATRTRSPATAAATASAWAT